MILDGKKLSDTLRSDLKDKIDSSDSQIHLAIILVWDNPASHIYTQNKKRSCQDLGMKCDIFKVDSNTTQEEVLNQIRVLNDDTNITGILVQAPLPNHMNLATISEAISPLKDVDGFTSTNVFQMYQGATQGLLPATPKGIVYILQDSGTDISGSRITIVGRSTIVGKPLSMLLTNLNATVTLCHSRTPDLKSHLQNADIIISAVGIPGLINPEEFTQKKVFIDVGINRIGEKQLVGDMTKWASTELHDITPVPGGVGPMTIAMLLENLYLAHLLQTTGNIDNYER